MLAMSDKDGIVEGSVPGLAHMAGLTIPETEAALKTLSSPDLFSRTKIEEGRRVEVIDGGWFLINHAKYRAAMSQDDRREYMKELMRERRKKSPLASVSTPLAPLAQAEAEADTKAEGEDSSLSQEEWLNHLSEKHPEVNIANEFKKCRKKYPNNDRDFFESMWLPRSPRTIRPKPKPSPLADAPAGWEITLNELHPQNVYQGSWSTLPESTRLEISNKIKLNGQRH